ncbi:MAG: DUF1653 domain-containing protein [Parcubacteria group bacterium]|nr:MAG: DUF1653 domain-containing protein [Parcubacteria group bacterium]
MKINLGKYLHYKGDTVEVIGTAKHSETLEDFVIYKHLTGQHTGEVHFWVRPLAMFLEEVESGGVKVPRFKYLG